MKQGNIYTGEHTAQISFPLGGIGSGCIGLSGTGTLIDWEIFNRPNKNTLNQYSGFAIKAYRGGKLVSAKIIAGPYQPPYMGQNRQGEMIFSGYGFGPVEKTFAGYSHFAGHTFTGEFPIAELRFCDPDFPGQVVMKAFNPFIPLNEDDSSIPCAMFDIRVENDTEEDCQYAVCLFVCSSFSGKQSKNDYWQEGGASGVLLGTDCLDPGDLDYGQICIATDAADVSYQQYWFRGGWSDAVEMFWRDFTSRERFVNRVYAHNDSNARDTGLICAHFPAKAGASGGSRFVISWNYPNRNNYWNPKADKTSWKNYYAVLFPDARQSARYSLAEWDRLYRETDCFRRSLYGSALDPAVIDAVASNLSVLKSPTCLRLEDGSFYAFEGCQASAGSCEGSCTHVWNYAYAMPYLFPALERSMRENDFRYNQWPDGKMSFRLNLPLGSAPNPFRACVDGQMGGVLKSYREWKLSGDSEWLKTYWPSIKASLEYAWAPTNPDKWDAGKTGVMTGRQHHTLDMEMMGPNGWLNGFYLAALKAGAEMAECLGEGDAAAEYRKLFASGKKYTDEELFNGEYYEQKIDLRDYAFLKSFYVENSGDYLFTVYWNEESGEIKYQVGDGCLSDQLVAQWHANLLGLGEIFDKEQTRTTLSSIYRYNYKTMRDVHNLWRVFSLNDESGVLLCTWPEGKTRPAIPVPYVTETWTGVEYQLACHMIQEGMTEEGLRLVRSVRERFDGKKRNPWNEFECGSNYARSMSSYSLLLAFSGFRYDGVEKRIGFFPVCPENFRSFFSCGSGWGEVRFTENGVSLELLYGSLELREFSASGTQKAASASLGGTALPFDRQDGRMRFAQPVRMKPGDVLAVTFAR